MSDTADAVVPLEGADFLPLAFRFDGDFLVHYMSVDLNATVAEVCSTAAGYVAGYRLPERSGALQLTFNGVVQPSGDRARDVGIGWLDYVQVDVVAS